MRANNRWNESNCVRKAPLALVLSAALWLVAAAGSPLHGQVCGDGVVEAPEVCDDGGTIAGDGCGPTCALEANTCIDDVVGKRNNCTADDVKLALLAEILESDGCDFPGDTAQVQIQTKLIATSAKRWDIGIFIALDGLAARTGSCHHNYLPPPLAPLASYNPGSLGLGNGTGPFLDDDADSCGDLTQGVETFYDLRAYNTFTPGDLQTLTIKCVDTDNNGFVDVGSCVSWDNNQNNPSCDNVNEAVPNTVAKCRCETLNTNLAFPGKILVDKITDPSGSPIEFEFNLSGGPVNAPQDIDFSLTDATPVFGPGDNGGFFQAGTYTLTEENIPAGWDLTALTCTDADGGTTVDVDTATATIDLDPAQTITCTFTDTAQPGNIVVMKETDPNGDATSFNFTASYDEDGFSLSDGQQDDSGDLDKGTYSVSETVPSGWDLTSSSCVSSIGDPNDAPASIDLDWGETVTCTFNNTQRGHIIVDKVTDPSGSDQSFTFTTTGAGYAGFSLKDADPANDQSLAPGAYTVSETAVTGWDLTSATCTSSIPNDTEAPGAIDLNPGETVTCTFNNTQRGHIIVDKVTDPSGSDQSFTFTTSGAGYAGFSLEDADAANDQSLAPGAYTVSETAVTGWDLTSASCTSSIPEDTEAPGAIDLNPGETVTCTFTNTQRGHIIVDKVTDPSGSDQSFTFTTTGAGYAGFSLEDTDVPNDQSLAPGAYTVSETAVSDWDLTSATCTSSIPEDTEAPGAIDLNPGETVTCTFTNTQRGHIIVDKVTDPSGSDQSFTFTTSGAGYVGFSLEDADPANDQSLAPGAYTVSETAVTGWDLTSATCTSSIPEDTEAPGAIDLNPGETVTCTFNNTQRGHIIVDKVTDPSGSDQSFTFTTSGAGYAGFSLKDADAANDQSLAPGAYTVSETAVTGWDLTSATCTSSIPEDTEAPGAIDLNPGETVTCTFNNTQRGHIIVDKVTDPSGSDQSFTFTTTGAGYVGFSLKDADAANDQSLAPGAYTASETAVTGWDLTSATCTSSIPNDTEAPGAIDLNPGETVTCTFNNTQRGHIVVDKVTDPSGSDQSFAFTTSGAGFVGFSLKDADAANDQSLAPGAYTVSETAVAGWDLTGATCTSSIPEDTEAPGSIDLNPGETVTCTFNNTQRGHIVVDKVTDPSGSDQSFTFTTSGAGYVGFSLEDADPANDQSLAPGAYTVSETAVAGWDLTGATCTSSIPNDTESPGAIDLNPGETVTCTFNNQQDARVVVLKHTIPAGEDQVFGFSRNWGAGFGLRDGEIFDSGDLDPGQYGVDEDGVSGWDVIAAACLSSRGDTETIGSISLQAGEIVTCEFTNRKRGTVTVTKTSNGVVDPTKSINFTLVGPGVNASFNTFNDADGTTDFGGVFLIPGETYTVCEAPVPAGWTSFWERDGVIVVPYNPNGDDVPPEDLGHRCFDFTVEPGQATAFEIDNSFPGGDPRTIGYWKNWNRCTSGGQAANAAQNGGAAAGYFLVEDVLPQVIGNFNVSTCAQAVKLLDKRDQASKKKADDAAYELGSQFLATRFNLAAGAETCQAVQDAVVAAQALLVQINFTGSGDYLGSKVKGAKLVQRNQALQLARTLDQYNNGLLCSP